VTACERRPAGQTGPYSHPYNCPIQANTRQHGIRKRPVQTGWAALNGRAESTMDIFEGTEQIQQGIIARAISEGRIDPLR